MRAFVTGCTGFVGQHLMRALEEAHKHFTVGLRRDVLKDSPRWAPDVCAQGDLSDIAHLERLMSEYGIDTVFHLAAQTAVSTAIVDPMGTFGTNLLGTWNVLEACRRQKVKRVIVASSDKAYGRTPSPYIEHLPLTPDRPYETSKACADMIARTYAATYGMSVAVTRCANLYGPGHTNFTALIPRTIKRIIESQSPVVRDGGRMKRDWLYVGDAVDAYLKLAASDYVGAMNFGTGLPTSVREVVDTLLDITGSDLPVIDEPDKQGEIVDQWTDYTAATKILGWQPQWNLRAGLSSTVGWYVDYFA